MELMSAAIVTVGSELTRGLRVDTNTSEIARALSPRGFHVVEALSVGDSVDLLAHQLGRLCATHDLVVTTGGLGPTHDDITREAASHALGVPLVTDARLVEWLQPVVARHTDPDAAAAVLLQAEVFEGAEVIYATSGTAPGLVITTPAGLLALLPGPPTEMRPMLDALVSRYPLRFAEPAELGVVGMTEADTQHAVQRALAGRTDIELTILARPGDVRVLLADQGAGEAGLADAVSAAAHALGERCYSREGLSLPAEIVRGATSRGLTIALAESCTGGMTAEAITDVSGASAVFSGSIVSYSNESKTDVLGVPPELIAEFGAVSEECVVAMARGARDLLKADLSAAVSGIAGPGGGTPDKPVGTVWFAVTGPQGSYSAHRLFSGTNRRAVRLRASSVMLDMIRRQVFALKGLDT